MASLATFMAGFITRPLGGVVIGIFSDRVGRRPAMLISFGMMGVSIISLALIPSYAAIGVAAPILAIAARMVQGFSLGGEVGPTTAYLVEAAPAKQRGMATSWQGASQATAATLAALVGLVLSNLLSAQALESYGWRIAFLIGAATLPYGLWLRRRLPETRHAPEAHPTSAPGGSAAELLAGSRRIIGLALLVFIAGTIATYVGNYMTTFAQHTLHMPASVAFAGSACANIAGIAGGLYGGWLSDRVGRRPVMIWPALVNLVALLPVFFWITSYPSALSLIVGTVFLSIFSAMGAGAFYPAVVESLPKPIRGSTFGIVYALAISIFGGTTQLVITWLIHVTGSNMAPAYYLLAASLLGFGARWLILESAPAKVLASGDAR